MKILITGASGFIGRRLLSSFQHSPHDVFALVRKKDPGLEAQGFRTFIIPDITQSFRLSEEFDIVFHLAGCNFTHVGVPSEDMFHQVNVVGTESLIRSGRMRHFVLMSTVKVYKPVDGDVDESYPLGPVGDYAKSKLASEQLCQSQLPKEVLTIFRSVNVIGPGQAEKAVVPIFLKQAIGHETLNIMSPQKTLLQLLDVDDVVNAFHRLLTVNKGCGVMNLSPDQTLPLEELAKAIIEITRSKSNIKFTAGTKKAQRTRYLSLKARDILGWTATTAVNDTLNKCFFDYQLRK